jgi:hypothetical protein
MSGPLTRADRYERPATDPNKADRALVGAWMALAAVIGVMATLIALGGMVLSFRAVSVEMVPAFGARFAWLVPVVVDLAVFVFSGVDLVLARMDMGHPLARWTVYGATGGTVYLNWNAGGNIAGRVAHVLMPSIWVVFVELMRHIVRRQVGLTTGSLREPIPVARWLLSPVPTFLLFRRMVLWRVNDYTRALEMERRRLGAVSVLREHGGRRRVSLLLRRQITWGEVDAEQVRAALNPAPKVADVSTMGGDSQSRGLSEIPQVHETHMRTSEAQYAGLAWVAANTVMLDGASRLRLVPGVPLVGDVPDGRTLRSFFDRGLVAKTPNRPVGLTVKGVGVLGYHTHNTADVPHYRAACELGRDVVVELVAPDGGLRSGPVVGVNRVDVSGTTLHIDVVGGGVEVLTFPHAHLLRVVGVVVDGSPVRWVS